MIISAPASSANLGPGFDALGLALDVDFSICFNEQPRGGAWEPATKEHPAIVAYSEASGITPLSNIWIQSHIPYARGMGFSGAARVAGAYGAMIQNGMAENDARDHAFRVAGDLEGHDDNAAASTYGGFCVTTAGHVMRFDCEPESQGLVLVMFIPEVSTSTKESRTKLPESYSRAENVQTIGNVALLTAMFASNTFNDEVLRIVTQDVVHQPARLKASPPSRAAFEEFQKAGAITQWLSGSGPSIAALIEEEKVSDAVTQVEQLKLDCAFSCAPVAVSQVGVREVISE